MGLELRELPVMITDAMHFATWDMLAVNTLISNRLFESHYA